MAAGHSLGISPENRGVVLSERNESKGDESGASGLPGGSTIDNQSFYGGDYENTF
jgi:putative hemolysin